MSGIWPLAIVIPNWNQGLVTVECVASVLAAAQDLPVIVCVVDNGSTDGSPDLLAETFGDRITQLMLEQNLGFAAAVNAGILAMLEQSVGSVLLLNNDTVVAPNMLTVLSQAAQQWPAAGILAPAIYYYDQPDRIWRLADRHYYGLPIPRKVSDNEAQQATILADYVTGCSMLIRSHVVRKVGLFDEQFFMYYEDADFCRRASEDGIELLCVPAARMWHKVSTSTVRHSSERLYWQARGQAFFYRKHARGVANRLLTHTYLMTKTVVTLMQLVVARDWLGVSAIVRGTRDGYYLPIQRDKLDSSD